MRTTVEKMIHNLGTNVTVYHNGESAKAKSIFVPTTSRSWQNMQNVFTELGVAPRGQYNYIGALEPVIEKGDLLDVGERRSMTARVLCIAGDCAWSAEGRTHGAT